MLISRVLVQVNNGATILELEWEPIEGNVQRVCVGWIGGIVKTRAAHRSETSHVKSGGEW